MGTVNAANTCVDTDPSFQQEQKKEEVKDETKKDENMEDELTQHNKMLSLQRENMHPFAYKILDFWYPATFNECMELWFGKSSTIDDKIKSEFSDILTNALDHHKYDSWVYSSPFECLALIILLDQFPRNIYRNNKKMYSADRQCQAILSTAMWKCYHLELLPIHAVSFCLVLTHSENVVLQQLCIRVWAQIRKYMPANSAHDLTLFDAIFQKHFDVIEKWGRFPHRNEILERVSTKEEKIFLSKDEFRFDLPLKPTDQGFGFIKTASYMNRFDEQTSDNVVDEQKISSIDENKATTASEHAREFTMQRLGTLDVQKFDLVMTQSLY